MTEVKNRTREDDELLYVMSTPRGRSFINKLINTSGFYQSSFYPESANANLFMAFNEGKRFVGMGLYKRAKEVCPEYLELMLKESFNNEGAS